MIKRLRPLLILAGSAILLGVILWVLVAFVLPKDEAGNEKGNAVVLMDVNLTKADSVRVKNTFDQYTLVKKTFGSYYIQGKEDLAVNNESVKSFLEELGKLTATKKVIDSPSKEQLESYGLAEPYGTVTVVNGKKEYAFSFGTTSSSGNYYTRMDGDNAVYLVDTTVPDIALLSRYQFYSDMLIDYSGETEDLEGLTNIVIDGNGREQRIEIEMNDLKEDEVGTTYVMKKPIYQPLADVKQDEFNELMGQLSTSPVVGDDVTKAGLKEYGLHNPEYVFSYVLDEEEITIYFGDVNDSGYRYCYAEGGKFVHYVEDTYTECLGHPLKEFCEDMIYTRSADAHSKIKVYNKKKSYTIDIGNKDEEGNFNVAINNKKVDSELFSDFYAHIITIGITDLGSKGENNEPYLTVEFTLQNGKTDVMKFYSVSELKCFCELNGSGLFWVSTLNVDRIIENAQKLYDGDVISLEW